MSEHTETPWWITRPRPGSSVQYIRAHGPGSNRAAVALVRSYRGAEQAEVDAEFIVHACNSHEELLEALVTTRELVQTFLVAGEPGDHTRQRLEIIEKVCDCALAKAEGRV